jgi:FkbM family methyltransferase
MHNWRQDASNQTIKMARQLFANTPIQRLSLTTKIYRSVFRFGNSDEEVTVSFRGITLLAPTKDETIVPGLVGGFYERIELDVFERLAAMSKTIVDVGANIGLYSCVAADRAPTFAKIVAFEPIAENLHYLNKNRERNERAARIVVEEEAVGESSGLVNIYLAEGQIGTHSVSAKNALDSNTSISVPMVCLDDYVDKKLHDSIELLKVDVEGYEVAVLRGAKSVLRKDRPTLFVEFIPDSLRNCNFDPMEFLDIVFDMYDHVFLVEEPRGIFKRCSRQDLLDADRSYRNANLIAISKASQRGHLNIVESVMDHLANGR